MPLTAMLLLYSICIIAGIFLVLKAISMRSLGERTPGKYRDTALTEDVDALADLEEAVPLQFLEENQTRLKRMSSASRPCPVESRRGKNADIVGASKRPRAYWDSLTAPFRALRRKGREPGGGTAYDEPTTSEIVLNPKTPLNIAVSALKRDEP